METLYEARATLQETMSFLGAISSGIEDAVGESASSITYVAGKDLGRRFAHNAKRTDNLEEALAEVRTVLTENQCLWQFESFQPTDRESMVRSTEEGEEILLVFRDCMIRQTLFLYGHHQKGSLCNMMFGFFAGAVETIMGRKSTQEVMHAGENASLKRLLIHR
jgi:predicted hydrocarbon binding protein